MTAQLNPRGDVAVLVPAAGAGVRLGPGAPKALRLLAVSRCSCTPSAGSPPHPRCASSSSPRRPPSVEAVRALLAPVAPVVVVAGGAERQQSVAAALAVVPDGVSDRAGARRCAGADAARRWSSPSRPPCAAACRAVIPVLPVVDTDQGGRRRRGRARHRRPVRAADRADAAGLPPGRAGRGARRAPTDPLTDDAGLVEKAGIRVACVPGTEYAMKITRPLDLVLAETLLRSNP